MCDYSDMVCDDDFKKGFDEGYKESYEKSYKESRLNTLAGVLRALKANDNITYQEALRKLEIPENEWSAIFDIIHKQDHQSFIRKLDNFYECSENLSNIVFNQSFKLGSERGWKETTLCLIQNENISYEEAFHKLQVPETEWPAIIELLNRHDDQSSKRTLRDDYYKNYSALIFDRSFEKGFEQGWKETTVDMVRILEVGENISHEEALRKCEEKYKEAYKQAFEKARDEEYGTDK